MTLTHGNKASWLETVWEALECYRENLIPEGVDSYDEEWNEICTAMAWIEEEVTRGMPSKGYNYD